jgi:hypothetical protein
MQLPSFLRLDASETIEFSEDIDGKSHGYAKRGCTLGCLFAIYFWFVPLPVAVIVWLFGLNGPFGDYMLGAIPFFLALPLVGGVIGMLVRRCRRAV